MKFIVTFERNQPEYAMFEVEASSAAEAESIATKQARADDLAWVPSGDAEPMHVESIEPTTTEPSATKERP